jgi:predicted transcriptional regulator
MACINVDGTLTASARRLLVTLVEPRTAEDAAARTDLPLFRVRASFREFLQAGLVAEASGAYVLTDAGRSKLAGQA